MPYFSILLPTKNRSHLVGFAIRSCLQQDFSDFEVIICDNDDDSVATKNVVKKFSDPRIKYIRTGGLDMISNWNSALDMAKGQHITVLEDKMIFYPGALSEITQHIQSSPSGVVVWKRDVVEDEGEVPIFQQQTIDEDQIISSGEVLKKVVTDVMSNWTLLPRGLCSSVPKVIIDEIVNKMGRAFYETTSPDFVSAIKLLSHLDNYLLAGGVYSMITSNKVSNGKNLSHRKGKDLSYFMGAKKFNLNLNDVYVKSELIVVNGVIADYFHHRKQIGGKLKQFDVTHRSYFKMLLRELVVTSLSERRLIWEWWEIRQLFVGGDGLITNMVLAIQYLSHLIRVKLVRLVGKNKRGLVCTKLDTLNDTALFVNQYLDGKVDISDRGSYD